MHIAVVYVNICVLYLASGCCCCTHMPVTKPLCPYCITYVLWFISQALMFYAGFELRSYTLI